MERKEKKQENLDLNLSELIYVLESVMKKFDYTIVLEDLDRFDSNTCLSIFSKLRQINVMINNRVDMKRKHRFSPQKRYLKFVYVCKDNVFNDLSDKYKFFDVILPIPPSLGKYNAKSYLVKRWNSDELKVARDFIEEIVPYLTDYRMINNIENECKTFSDIYLCRNTGVDSHLLFSTECMAFIIYKNLYPNEYIEITDYKKDKTSSLFENLILGKSDDERKKILSKWMSLKTLRFIGYNRSEIEVYYRNILNSGDDRFIGDVLEDDVKDVYRLSDIFAWKIYNTHEEDNTKFREWVNTNPEVFLYYLVKICAFTYENEEQENLKDIIEKNKELQCGNQYPVEVCNLRADLENDYCKLRSFNNWLSKNGVMCA